MRIRQVICVEALGRRGGAARASSDGGF